MRENNSYLTGSGQFPYYLYCFTKNIIFVSWQKVYTTR